MPRIQFSLKTLLWLTLVVAAFFSGIAIEKRLEQRRRDAESDFPLLSLPTPDDWKRLERRR